MSKQFLVKKGNGESVPFEVNKLRNSLEHSGAGINDINRIINEVEEMLFDGISTKAIYKKAFSMLKRHSKPAAAKYKLKKALFELGPTGYPFEKFVGELLKHQGYKVQVGVIVQGHCVQHEIDVVAIKEDKQYMIECKFHKDDRTRCNVQVPLYINSRFYDVKAQWEKNHENHGKFQQGWIVTNTGFTGDAIQYGTCIGLNLIGWDFPKHGSLKERIDNSGLHPITSLSTLSKSEKQRLLDKGIVLCMDICKNQNLLKDLYLDEARIKRVLEEAGGLCGID